MIRQNEDALICDFAETYHVFDYKRLPVQLAAVLAAGLRDESRIKMELAGLKVSPNLAMQAAVIDRLGLLVWFQTKDAVKGRNRPKPLVSSLVEHRSDVNAFDSGEDFEEERTRILRLIGGADGH